MSLRWSKRDIPPSCSSRVRWYVKDSKTEVDGCYTRDPPFEGRLDSGIRSITSRGNQYREKRRHLLRNRAPASNETNTNTVSRQDARPTTTPSTAATGLGNVVTTPSSAANMPSITVNILDITTGTPAIVADTSTNVANTPNNIASALTVAATTPTVAAITSSIAANTPSIVATTSVPSTTSVTAVSTSHLLNVSPPSASTNATTSALPRSRIALIAGASGGGFVAALLIAAILFFWLHTRRSRQQHQRTFDRRMSEPGMIQKQLTQHPIVTRGSLRRVHPQRKTPLTPSRSARSLIQPPTPSTSSDAPSSSVSSSSSSANSWPLRTVSHSDAPSYFHTNSATISANTTIDPHPYRHYSAEHFHVPESPAGPFNAWKVSQPPDGPHVRPEDLWRQSIGMFELETPISPEEYDAATSRKPSLTDRPATSRNSSFQHGGSSSRKSSVGSELGILHPDVPAVPPPAMVGGTGSRAWNTHRKSSSSGVL